jgi:hypothetical protein
MSPPLFADTLSAPTIARLGIDWTRIVRWQRSYMISISTATKRPVRRLQDSAKIAG